MEGIAESGAMAVLLVVHLICNISLPAAEAPNFEPIVLPFLPLWGYAPETLPQFIQSVHGNTAQGCLLESFFRTSKRKKNETEHPLSIFIRSVIMYATWEISTQDSTTFNWSSSAYKNLQILSFIKKKAPLTGEMSERQGSLNRGTSHQLEEEGSFKMV